MPFWLIIAALVTIGATALLTAILYRINAPLRRAAEADAPARDEGAGHNPAA